MLTAHGQLGTTGDIASELLCLLFLEMFLQPGDALHTIVFTAGGARLCSFGSGRSVGLRGMRIPDTSITKKFFFYIVSLSRVS